MSKVSKYEAVMDLINYEIKCLKRRIEESDPNDFTEAELKSRLFQLELVLSYETGWQDLLNKRVS